mmetsp:Transcript_23437/g.47927  ORF Transcript_23437/g.47927 Transcript_23437/m.47927 type:complete len:256 (+) Transcript_23437:1161-1928(+)
MECIPANYFATIGITIGIAIAIGIRHLTTRSTRTRTRTSIYKFHSGPNHRLYPPARYVVDVELRALGTGMPSGRYESTLEFWILQNGSTPSNDIGRRCRRGGSAIAIAIAIVDRGLQLRSNGRARRPPAGVSRALSLVLGQQFVVARVAVVFVVGCVHGDAQIDAAVVVSATGRCRCRCCRSATATDSASAIGRRQQGRFRQPRSGSQIEIRDHQDANRCRRCRHCIVLVCIIFISLFLLRSLFLLVRDCALGCA